MRSESGWAESLDGTGKASVIPLTVRRRANRISVSAAYCMLRSQSRTRPSCEPVLRSWDIPFNKMMIFLRPIVQDLDRASQDPKRRPCSKDDQPGICTLIVSTVPIV